MTCTWHESIPQHSRSFARASGEPASTASWRSFVRHTGWLNAESQAARGEVLEIAILALMAVEIVLSFFH